MSSRNIFATSCRVGSVKSAFATSLAVLAPLACVPASEAPPPAGAAGFVTEPSAAALGEPFTTADGWIVRIDTIHLQAIVTATPVGGADHPDTWYGGGLSDSWLIDGSKPALMYARELAPGGWRVEAQLDGSYVSTYYDSDFDNVVNLGLSKGDEARFRRFADVGYGHFGQPGATTGPGPSVVIVLHAERDGRTIDLDLSFGGGAAPSAGSGAARRVRANAVDAGPLGVQPERILGNPWSGGLLFDPIAAADADGDGHVTAVEVMAAPPPAASAEQSRTLGDVLVLRCNGILVQL